MWICPDCDRKFSRNNQSHSCVAFKLEDQFIGKNPRALELYDYLVERLKVVCEFEIFPGKTYLSFRRLSAFATIMVEKSHLTIIFISREPIDEFPVHQTHQHSQNRSTNVIKVESKDEIDDQLIGWLTNAWVLAT